MTPARVRNTTAAMPPPIHRLLIGPNSISQQAPSSRQSQIPKASSRDAPPVPVSLGLPQGRAPARPARLGSGGAFPSELLSSLASRLSLEDRAKVRRRYAERVPTGADAWAALSRTLSIDPLLDSAFAPEATVSQKDSAAFADWCEALRIPGHWNPAAARPVAQVLPGLPGWPAGKVADPVAMPDPAPLDATKQKGLDTLASWIEESHWDSKAGDIAPQLITRLPGWPSHLVLELRQPDCTPLIYGESGKTGARPNRQRPVVLWKEAEHYSALVRGKLVQVPADGNCFYRAIIEAMDPEDARALTLSADRTRQAGHLRMALAGFVRSHPELVSQWVDLEDIAMSEPLVQFLAEVRTPSPPTLSRPQAKGKIWRDVEKSKAVLDELLALSEKNKTQNPRRNPLNGEIFKKCAEKSGFSAATLRNWVAMNGKVKLPGHAVQQAWERKQLGGVFENIDAEFLLNLRALAKDEKNPLELSDDCIVAIARHKNISINHLRVLINKNGDLTETGKNKVAQADNSILKVRYGAFDFLAGLNTRAGPVFNPHPRPAAEESPNSCSAFR